MASVNTAVWNARRAVLELYGWITYHLCHDSDWHNRDWDGGVRELVSHWMRFLDTSRRGCIIDPASTSLDHVITLVRHQVPIHYQWPAKDTSPILGGWQLTPAASCFNPYNFKRAHDHAAFLQVGGIYNSIALDQSILGRNKTTTLSAKFHAHPRPRRFSLPAPLSDNMGIKKKKADSLLCAPVYWCGAN